MSVGVADHIVGRSAKVIAHATRWGKRADDFHSRELDLEVGIARGEEERDRYGPLGSPDCEVYIDCSIHSLGEKPRDIEIRDARLSDLPLLAMALHEAIRVGIKRGSFPPLLGAQS